MMTFFRSLAIALSMYSKIPVPTVEWDEKSMKYALCFFPFVGVITGALQFLLGYFLLRYTSCGKALFGAVMTLLPIAVSGGIHMDGFADTMDALSSYGDREKKLEILKDSHSGAFAVMGLCGYFLLTFGLWSQAGLREMALAAFIYPFSRALSGLSVVTLPSARGDGLLHTFQKQAQKQVVIGVLLGWAVLSAAGMGAVGYAIGGAGASAAGCAIGGAGASAAGYAIGGAGASAAGVVSGGAGAALCTGLLSAAAALAGGGLAFFHYRRLALRQFGGTTGDLAGYFLQVCELVMLALLVVVGGGLWS